MLRLAVVVLFALVIRDITCYTSMDVNSLHDYLFNNSSGYNKYTRPIKNQSFPVQIDIVHGLLSLESYDITTGTVIIQGYFLVSWTDELLVWNLSQFNGIERISVPGDLIWTPYLISLDYKHPIVLTDSPIQAFWLANNGSVNMYTGGLYESKCDTETTKYPLDFHKCIFSILTPKYNGDQIRIYTRPDLDLQNFTENEEWNVDQGSFVVYYPEYNGIKWSFADATFVITRRPAFVLMHDFTSISLLCWLNIVTCLVPPSSGERLSFSVTLFLAFSLQSSQIFSNLPRNSVSMAPFNLCIILTNILCALGTIWSVCIVRVSKLNYEKVLIPKFLKTLHVYVSARKSCATTPESNIEAETFGGSNKLADLEAERASDGQEVNTYTQTDGLHETTLDDNNQDNPVNITWVNISETLDKTYFAIVTLILFLSYPAFFLVNLLS